MTGGDIAGLIAAGVFAILVALLAVPIIKLGRVFDELRLWIRDLNEETEPLIDEVVRTVATTNSQLEKVDGITDNVSDASANVSAMTSLVASTVGQPIIKVAAFSSGVRRAFSPEAARARREQTRRMRSAADQPQPRSPKATAPETASGTGAEGAQANTEASSAATVQPSAAAFPEPFPETSSAATFSEASPGGPAEEAATTNWWEGTEFDTAAGDNEPGASDVVDGEAVSGTETRESFGQESRS